MEQNNSQELNKKMFSDLIYDPSAIQADNSKALESLIEKYPYSQLIRAFYSRSLLQADSADFESSLARAALYSGNGNILRTLIEDAERLKSAETREEVSPAPVLAEPEKSNMDPDPVKDTLFEPDPSEPIVPQDLDGDDDQIEEIRGLEDIEHILSPEAESPENEVLFQPEIDDAPIEKEEKPEPEPAADLADSDVKKESPVSAAEAAPSEEDELDLLIKQHAIPADYLKEEEITEPLIDQTENVFRPEADIAENISHNVNAEEQQKVSKYDDDKMPYSFLWWLNKTRKEHTENYQPYVNFQLDTTQSIKRNTVDQLSSQIIENIFHLQSPVDQFENAPRTVPFQVKRKEDYILEKFLREEPQIKAPNSDKLDTENKARKSAEDPNDLVSETLAQIYTDQMLFHKAIDTYKKLSLKFPEKSPYFADQIRELEKKVN
ncbi:hypothetical protein [Daejeonella sp. JGW-45]|uniref:hypothetical protein n=1 Tax=Daejeonella sp. JGW-45 TaxID=3034148 RepID=UPI0023EC0E01|nr:hypothetical protein [Daejeonella sp. JGW-45]